MAVLGSSQAEVQEFDMSHRPAPQQIAVLGQFVAKPGHEKNLRAKLLSISIRSRQEDGVIKFDALASRDNPAQFFLWECWTNRSARIAYKRSSQFAVFSEEIQSTLIAPISEMEARMLSDWDQRTGKRHPQGSPDQLTIVAFSVLKTERIEATRQALLAMVPLTRSESGNIDFDLFQIIDLPNVIFFVENWDDKAVLGEHMGKSFFTEYVRRQADANLVMPWTYLSLEMISPPGLGRAAR